MNSAEWMFGAIITAFGGGFCALLSESLKNKPALFYVVKGIGVACTIAFIVIMFCYPNGVDVESIVKTKKMTTASVNSLVGFVEVFCAIFGIIGLLAQGTNIALNIIYKIDD